MTDLHTYSVVIRWSDSYDDMGDYGEYVRARDAEHAERIVRARMVKTIWRESLNPGESRRDVLGLYDNGDGTFFGSVTECTEGAIWKAKDMESILRDLVAAWDKPGGRIVDAQAVVERAQKIVAELDAI